MIAGEHSNLSGLVASPFEHDSNMGRIVTTLTALNATCANILLALDRLQTRVNELERKTHD